MLLGTPSDLGVGLPLLRRDVGNEHTRVHFHRSLLACGYRGPWSQECLRNQRLLLRAICASDGRGTRDASSSSFARASAAFVATLAFSGGASARSRGLGSVELRSVDGLAWSAARPLGLLLEFPDEAGGVELDQQLAQLVELRRSQLLFQFGLDLGDGLADCAFGGVSSLGEVYAFDTLVVGVVIAGEVAELL